MNRTRPILPALALLLLAAACDRTEPEPTLDRDAELAPVFAADLHGQPIATDCRDAYFCALDTCAADMFGGDLTVAEAHECALSCEPDIGAFLWGQYLNASLESCGFGWGTPPDADPTDDERVCLANAWNPWTGDAGIAGERLSTCMRSGANAI